jgi:hypothetical protein
MKKSELRQIIKEEISKLVNESKSNPEIDKLLKIMNTKKAGPEYKKALMDLIAMAEKKSGKTVNTKKEALLALDYVEPLMNEANGFKSGKEFINIKLQKYPKAVAKVNQLINMIGESKFTMEMAEWIFDFFNNASYESPINEAKSSYFKIGDIVELKNMPENLPYEIRNGIVDNKWEIIKVSKSGRSMYSDVMEDVFGYDIELLDKKLKYKMFVYPEDVKSSMNEAKSEDKVDTITMDVPLFIRMLEYSREDAVEDMDLHDVTEKVNLLGKERGILSMEDYDEIVGAAEKINETRFSKPTGSPYEQKDLYAQELFGIEYFSWLDFWEQFHIVQKYKLDRSIITKEGKEGSTTFKVGDIVSKDILNYTKY